MISINEKTVQDLQFPVIRETVAENCITDGGREKALSIQPFRSDQSLRDELQRTWEYVSSFENDNALPNHGFQAVTAELKFLSIEDSQLEAGSFRNLARLAQTANELIQFLRKFDTYYPKIKLRSDSETYTRDIEKEIERVIDPFGEVKDNASPQLAVIREQINLVRSKINQSFNQALSHYNSLGYLDDIRESVVDNRRVLAVIAMNRRKVKGSALGTSKTGSIIFIEPEATLRFTRELADLELEEREEIRRILKKLSDVVRPFVPVLASYESFLADIDLLYAKARYAIRIGGILPKINDERRLHFRNAFHPILLLNNRKKNQPVYPQDFELDPEHRIVVISGPNAGGKTISLKTVGLLQLMLQSGLLIPVHERSETFLFDRILTDIGDNQSIENHLSTYSYRLKNMNYFLRKCNSKTLFLIDEFGTGSDPELGGALAEVFLEEFYHRESYGIITTHYANLKMLANELPFAANANMLFDEKSLEPMYKLVIGQAGSSFTFEVAQKNGIPYGLVNRAKKKIEGGKVRFDKTIAKLQKERTQLEKTSQNLREEEVRSREENRKLEDTNQRVRQKLESYQELYDSNQKTIYLGQKVEDMAEKYFNSKNKKDLIGEFLKMVEIENSKRKKLTVKEKKVEETRKKEVVAEVKLVVEEIRQEKKEKKKKEAEAPKPKVTLKVGDRVRMLEGKAVGSIDAIEKNKATVNYGLFTSKVNLEELELVERKK